MWSRFLLDVFLGRAKYSAVELEKVETSIPMPERSYPCTVTMQRAEWRRPRWPFVRRVLRAEVEIPGGVPHPGKGTESYNCGDDGLYGLTAPAQSVEDAIGMCVANVLDKRRRYPL